MKTSSSYQVDALKNRCSHFKLIPCFWFIIIPYAKFHPNRTKNQKGKNFQYWSVLVHWAGRSKNGRRHFKLILCCFCSIISTHTKLHPNWMKIGKVENFHFGRFWLVGLVGRKMVVGITPRICCLFSSEPFCLVHQVL